MKARVHVMPAAACFSRRGMLAASGAAMILLRSGFAAWAQSETAANDALRGQLRSFGDDGRTPRWVDHWAYPNPAAPAKPTGRKAVTEALRRAGYTVDKAPAGGLTFGREAAVAGKDFDRECEQLAAFFRGEGWYYDGWESVLVRNN